MVEHRLHAEPFGHPNAHDKSPGGAREQRSSQYLQSALQGIRFSSGAKASKCYLSRLLSSPTGRVLKGCAPCHEKASGRKETSIKCPCQAKRASHFQGRDKVADTPGKIIFS